LESVVFLRFATLDTCKYYHTGCVIVVLVIIDLYLYASADIYASAVRRVSVSVFAVMAAFKINFKDPCGLRLLYDNVSFSFSRKQSSKILNTTAYV